MVPPVKHLMVKSRCIGHFTKKSSIKEPIFVKDLCHLCNTCRRDSSRKNTKTLLSRHHFVRRKSRHASLIHFTSNWVMTLLCGEQNKAWSWFRTCSIPAVFLSASKFQVQIKKKNCVWSKENEKKEKAVNAVGVELQIVKIFNDVYSFSKDWSEMK